MLQRSENITLCASDLRKVPGKSGERAREFLLRCRVSRGSKELGQFLEQIGQILEYVAALRQCGLGRRGLAVLGQGTRRPRKADCGTCRKDKSPPLHRQILSAATVSRQKLRLLSAGKQ